MLAGTGFRMAELESLNVLRRTFIQKEVKGGFRLHLMCSRNCCDSVICRRMTILFRVEQRRSAKTRLTAGTPLGSVNGLATDLKRVMNCVGTRGAWFITQRVTF